MNSKTVLIADDDLGLMKVISVRLEAEGYRCVCTQDAYFAVALAHKEQPDLLLLDINMPAGTGFSVHSRLRSSEQLASIPVIYITGEPMGGISERPEVQDAACILSKPFETNELLACIRETLGEADRASTMAG